MAQKTKHGEQRATEERPTGRAWNDAQKAGPNEVLLDTDSEYIIVLGSKARVHIFLEEEEKLKLHTSFRNPRSNTLMRLRTKRWRLLDEVDFKNFKNLLEQTLHES